MLTMRVKKLMVGVAVLAAPVFAMAQSAEQLIQKYTPLAGGCEVNAKSLVTGLRDGTKVTLAQVCPSNTTTSTSTSRLRLPLPRPPVEFEPPTGKMGFGNVDNALTLAQGSLANLNIVTGVADPSYQRSVTARDLRDVLMGTTQDSPLITPQGTRIVLPGILTLRSQGLGWGEIAQQVGAKL